MVSTALVDKDYLTNQVKDYDDKVVEPIRKYITVNIPIPPTTDGTYVLKIENGVASWVANS